MESVATAEFTLHEVADHRQARTEPSFAVLAFGVVTAGTVDFRGFWSFDSHPTEFDAAFAAGVAWAQPVE